jgi:hypothetical protein
MMNTQNKGNMVINLGKVKMGDSIAKESLNGCGKPQDELSIFGKHNPTRITNLHSKTRLQPDIDNLYS